MEGRWGESESEGSNSINKIYKIQDRELSDKGVGKSSGIFNGTREVRLQVVSGVS